MSMETKKTALAALIETTLQAFDENFIVDTRLRSVMLRGGSRAARIAVMGDPTRYAVVFHSGRDYITDSGTSDIGGRPKDTADVFEVQVWFGYSDDDVYADSSQKGWDDLLTGDTTGLLDVLVAEEWLDAASAALGTPSGISIDLVPLSNSTKELAHYASFTISVT